MRFRFILIFLLSVPFLSKAQRSADSIRQLIRAAASDTARAAAYVALTEEIGYQSPDSVIPLSMKILEISRAAHGGKTPAEKRSLMRSRANALNNIGLIYMNQGNIRLALDYFHQCLRLMETLDDKSGVALTLNNIGAIYRTQGDNIQALDFYLRALKIAREGKDKDGTAFSLGNIGVVYANQGNIDRAIACYKQSLEIRRELGDEQGMAMSLNNLGEMYHRKGLDSLSLEHYRASLEKWNALGDKDGVAFTRMNMGNLYLLKGDLTTARKLGEESFAISRELNFPEDLRDAADLLQRVYRAEGRWKDALKMQDVYITMRDSLNSEEAKKIAARKQLEYQFEKERLALNKEQEKKDAVRREERQRSLVVIIAVCCLLTLVVIFSLFLFNRFRLTSRQKKIIEEQKKEVEIRQKEVIDSIHYAQRIQGTLLAGTELLRLDPEKYFLLFLPKDIVSGDFYWTARKDDRLYLAICDSTGHGVPGAFMSLLNMSFLNEAVNEKNIESPAAIFDYVRERLIANVSQDGGRDGMDGVLLCLKEGENKFHYSAAYNAPVLIRNGSITQLPADKMPVGIGERTGKFTNHEIEYQSGDMLYIFTDGYADQFGGDSGKKFKYRRLNDLLLKICKLEPQIQCQQLESAFHEWKGELGQVDDVCIAGIRL